MSNPAKDLRKQLRTIVQEILPAFLSNEIGFEIQKKVQHDLIAYNAQRMEAIEKYIKEQLEQIAIRQKEVTDLLKAQIQAHSKPQVEVEGVKK